MSVTAAHRPITGRLVIATHNPGKLAEMRELLMPYGIDAISAGELGLPEPDETGDEVFATTRALRPKLPQRRPGCRLSPTIWG